MELKNINVGGRRTIIPAFNRTAYGIENPFLLKSLNMYLSFNRTAYGIEKGKKTGVYALSPRF
mgnify:CR=1 FL=1